MDKDTILSYLKEHKEEFKHKYGVTKLALFGSYARDEANENSDIDIAIEVIKTNFKNRMSLQYFLEKDLNKKIDLGYINTIRTSIKREIDKDIVYV